MTAESRTRPRAQTPAPRDSYKKVKATDVMTKLKDRRTLAQIGGIRAYLRQVAWSLRWPFVLRRRIRTAGR